MKLYATTTSERASKGQGGNDYLNIEICIDSKIPSHSLQVIPNRTGSGEPTGTYYIVLKELNSDTFLYAGYTKIGFDEVYARKVQNFGEQHPDFYSKEMKEWRNKEKLNMSTLTKLKSLSDDDFNIFFATLPARVQLLVKGKMVDWQKVLPEYYEKYIKGKSQKGECCEDCGATTAYSKKLQRWYCLECWGGNEPTN